MSNFLRSFSNIDRCTIFEVDFYSIESDHIEHERVEDPESWNPPILSSKEIYQVPSMFSLSRKNWLKEVELKIKISGSPTVVGELVINVVNFIRKVGLVLKVTSSNPPDLP